MVNLKNNFLFRHLLVGSIGVGLTYLFWLSRPQWDPEMRLWRAVGDGSFILLWFTLVVGPIAQHWAWAGRLLPWRREMGIWYGLLAFGHTYLVLLGWVRWDFMRFFGYEFVPELDRYARLEPDFGLSNAVGMVAVFITVLLVATSANWAINLLGASAWKWLQYGAYALFYLVVLHTFYFLFMHYTLSFHRRVPDDPNWFQYPFLWLTLIIPILQVSAFIKVVRRRNTQHKQKHPQRLQGGKLQI